MKPRASVQASSLLIDGPFPAARHPIDPRWLQMPVVDEVSEIVDGSITISGDPLANELQAEMSGILLERNGVRVSLDPVKVTNNCWGCFAG